MSSETSPLVEKDTYSHPKRTLVRSYWELMRLHKFPAGSDLVFWPCAWGVTMAAYKTGSSPAELGYLLLAYAVYATLFHSAACILNDICDRDLDRQVERCKKRPLASGDVSLLGASILCVALTLPGLYILTMANTLTFKVGIIGVFPFHTFYPLMKRVTNWPQAWLGLAMNWSFMPSYVSITNEVDVPLFFVMMVGFVCWTIHYDTIYACQDRKDDIKAGVKSTAVLFGDYVKPILSVFSSVVVAALAFAGYRVGLGYGYWSISVVFTAAHFAWQLITVDLDNGPDCWSKFAANGYLGISIWLGILVDYYLKVIA